MPVEPDARRCDPDARSGGGDCLHTPCRAANAARPRTPPHRRYTERRLIARLEAGIP